MASKAGARIKITLRCSECKQRKLQHHEEQEEYP